MIVQWAPAAKVDGLTGQVVLLAKFPLATIEFIFSGAVPLFQSYAFRGAGRIQQLRRES
jgi:hypothetical protein